MPSFRTPVDTRVLDDTRFVLFGSRTGRGADGDDNELLMLPLGIDVDPDDDEAAFIDVDADAIDCVDDGIVAIETDEDADVEPAITPAAAADDDDDGKDLLLVSLRVFFT